MQPRNTQGKFKRKPKGIFALVIIMTLIGVTLYYAGDKDAVETTVEPVATGDMEAQLSPEVTEYMNSPAYKMEMELLARTRVLEKKKVVIDEAYKANVAELTKTRDTDKLEIEMELEDIRKQQLEVSKSSLAPAPKQ